MNNDEGYQINQGWERSWNPISGFSEWTRLESSENNMNKEEKIARILYDAYTVAVGGKAFNGDDLPKSDEFFEDETKQKQANAWRIVAETAIDIIIE